jgi:phosphoribosylaminoimidazole-succinocarboxamide synthase
MGAALEGGNRFANMPEENYSRGLLTVGPIEGLGEPEYGKVRESYTFEANGQAHRLMITTDRLSAYDSVICTVPGKGAVLNLLSADWFNKTKDIVQNHMVSVPHPNILIAKQAEQTLPVEIVLRRYMAKSATHTSVYRNYIEGRRTIYGFTFPDGLKANQELPMGSILTPTTKSAEGHDEELTNEEARVMVDEAIGWGLWDEVSTVAHQIFEMGRQDSLSNGLLLVDTKYEFGLVDGKLTLIDEVHTPDSSRYWDAASYAALFAADKSPKGFDKEIVRKWLADNGFEGEGAIPIVDPSVIDKVGAAYKVPYEILTGKSLPAEVNDPISGADVAAQAAVSVLVYQHGKS